jgi:hypothetical protein
MYRGQWHAVRWDTQGHGDNELPCARQHPEGRRGEEAGAPATGRQVRSWPPLAPAAALSNDSEAVRGRP